MKEVAAHTKAADTNNLGTLRNSPPGKNGTGGHNTGKIVFSPDHGNHCDFQHISMILPTF